PFTCSPPIKGFFKIIDFVFYPQNRPICHSGLDPWFDMPIDRLTVLSEVEGLTFLSKVEGLTTLSEVEGESILITRPS
ncbi:MAG: hypothetical protein PVG87_25960, partial [Desulfobacteraceae bacterium]